MSGAVSSIRNLGPAADAGFARAGINSAAQLRDLGADEAYRRLLIAGTRPHFIGYYALVMGLQGRPWNDCQGKEKTRLRQRFDAICGGISAADTGRASLESALNEIGVIKRPD